MACDTDCGGNKQDVFDDVLPLHGGNEKSTPCGALKQDKWHGSGRHVNKEEGNDDALQRRNEPQNTDEAFEKTKENQKRIKRNARNSALEELLNEWTCGAFAQHLERPEPEKHREETKASKWHGDASAQSDNGVVK